MGVPEVVEPNPRKARSEHELLERIREQLWVGWLPVGSGEDVRVGVVGIELGVLARSVASPGVQDFEGARVEVDWAAGGARFASRFVEFVAD